MVNGRIIAPGLAVLSLIVLSCKDVAPPLVCPKAPIPGIVVHLADPLSGRPVLAPSEVVATEGAYADTVRGPPEPFVPGWAALAHDRPGTYHVGATAERYRPWAKEGVRVTQDECGAQTVELQALMQPVEGS